MRAVSIHGYKEKPELTFEDGAPEPKLQADDEVLIQMEYAGVNFIDVYFRKGVYKAPSFPLILGKEGVGRVLSTGSAVKEFKAGDKVGFCFSGPSYAEKVVQKQKDLLKIPEELDSKIACAAMLQGFTAHYLVNSTYQVKENDIVLVHAAAGGVGQWLCQMLVNKKARVIATVSNEEKAKIVRSFGVSDVIIYDNYLFLDQLESYVGKKKVNVVYDSVGAPTFEQNLDSLKPRGLLVLFGQSAGVVPPFDLNILNAKGSLFVTRPSLGAYLANSEETNWRAKEVFGGLIDGSMSAKVDSVFPIEKAGEAHARLEARNSSGKILLQLP